MLNDKKICIIMCVNNDVAAEECFHYIEQVNVPNGFDIECITIHEAEFMTKAYNEAMKQSDAKYKVYMHQDVFILNKNLFQDIVAIFQSDEKIGMIGMVGYKKISESGMMWAEPYIGKLYDQNGFWGHLKITDYNYDLEKDSYSNVSIIDGLMMITNRDLIWDEEDLDGWDFYDAYQSVNFLQNGLKIVVPNQRIPWCMHDDGHILNLYRYDEFRQKFLKKYIGFIEQWNKSIIDLGRENNE